MTRDSSFDILKGLGMMFVVMSHCDIVAVSHILYSFHMPLFFFIAGLFFKERPIKEHLYLDFRRLLIPYVAAFGCMMFFAIVGKIFFSLSLIERTFFSFFWGAGVVGNLPFSSEPLSAGPLWFLLSMFWVRLLYLFLNSFLNNVWIGFIFSVALALLGQYLAEKFGQIPLAIFPSFASFGCFYVGVILKKKDLFRSSILGNLVPFSIVCWILCILHSNFSLHKNMYDLYYVGNIFGSFGIFLVLKAVIDQYKSKNSPLWRGLEFIGKNSIVMLLVHSVEHCFFYRWMHLWFDIEMSGLHYSDFLIFALRFALMVCVGYLISKSVFICKKIFYR